MTSKEFNPDKYPILFNSTWNATDLYKQIEDVSLNNLCEEYRSLRKDAPSREQEYFYIRKSNRETKRKGKSNRCEELGAKALVKLKHDWIHPNGRIFWFLYYQFPLKACRRNKRIGKVDIVGVNDEGRLILTELKVEGKNGRRGDAPPCALMEGLRYTAIVQKNLPKIAQEARERYGKEVHQMPPIIQLLATKEWWKRWKECDATGDWQGKFSALIDGIEKKLKISIECLALNHLNFEYDVDDKPFLAEVPKICKWRLYDEFSN